MLSPTITQTQITPIPRFPQKEVAASHTTPTPLLRVITNNYPNPKYANNTISKERSSGVA
ncbi:MAG: hypothetical protein V4722_11410 [Bacteroidota bacterium]